MKKARFCFALTVALAAPVALVGAPRDAYASISIAVTYDGLLAQSSAAAVVIPAEERAVWENGRIYTYTRVGVDRAVAGDLTAGTEVWVRTMGGIIGNVGQRVDGEAVLTVGRPSLLFLHAGPVGSYEVTARGQGQFPIVLDEQKTVRLMKSFSAGALVAPRVLDAAAPPPRMAADAFHGRTLDEAVIDIAGAWEHAHAK
jgi:hypothetical protein